MLDAMKSAALSSSVPPISPTMTTRSVSGGLEALQDVDEAAAHDGVAADADDGALADAQQAELLEIQVSVPPRLTTPTRPGSKTWVGMIPTVAAPGLMTPGQFGPRGPCRPA